jgi:futalosine hydrolase
MKILLVAATQAEIEPLLSRLGNSNNPKQLIVKDFTVDVLVTGVGMVATAFAIGRHLALNQYELAINAGIAGSFDFTIALGEVVLVTEDIFAEQGAEDGEGFLSLKELGFGENSQLPVDFKNSGPLAGTSLQSSDASIYRPVYFKSLDKLKHVKAITVNKVHGHELTISKTLSRVKAQVESMEGAAFFYACNQSKTPCLQIRAISNYVERRDKEKWDINLAVKNLNDQLVNLLI